MSPRFVSMLTNFREALKDDVGQAHPARFRRGA